jgi:competence protein ComEA
MRRWFLVLLAWVALVAGACESKIDQAEKPPIAVKLDLNRATVKELEALPGIGEVKARSIMASRNARGGHFERLEDLLKIDGIGEKTLETIRPYVEIKPK